MALSARFEEVLEAFLNDIRSTDVNNMSQRMKKLEVQFARMYIKQFVQYQTFQMVLKPLAKETFSKQLTELDLIKIEKIFTEADLFNYNIKQSFSDFCKAIGKPEPSPWVKSISSDQIYKNMSTVIFKPVVSSAPMEQTNVKIFKI